MAARSHEADELMAFINSLWAIFEPYWNWLPELVQDVIIIVLQIAPLLVVIILMVAYLTFWERKIIGWMQNRIGPNRVGPWGLFQPFADTIKLILKEVIVPGKSNRFLFLIAPLLAITPALATWAVVPLFPGFAIAEIDAGLLYVLALTSLGVYGVIIAGWATNSKYAFLGAMRSAAQIVAYEIAMGFALVGVLMAGGSLNLGEIVAAQAGPDNSWFLLWLFPLFIVYFISGVAETNRAPFDVAEGESEIVAGFHVEYSGVAFAVFFLAEYANMILIAALTAVMFLGGWDSAFFRCNVRLFGRYDLRISFAGRGCIGSGSRLHSFCSFSCGFARRFRAIATTRSCGSAGRYSFRSRSSGFSLKAAWR